jgi:predicted nucleotidyltransferase
VCDKTALDTITKKVCTSAKEVLGNKLEKVVLFGSYARNDYNDYSDIDIMVLADIQLEEVSKMRRKIRDIMGGYNLDLEYNVIISMHVACSANFHKYINVLPFYKNVQKDGVILYA